MLFFAGPTALLLWWAVAVYATAAISFWFPISFVGLL